MKLIMSHTKRKMAQSNTTGYRRGARYHRMDDIPTDTFTPRTYQTELLDAALKHNIILCLGCSHSKVFLALMVAKHMSSLTRLPICQGGKRIVYFTDSDEEAEQLQQNLSHHTDLQVGRLKIQEGQHLQAELKENSSRHIFQNSSIIVSDGATFLNAIRNEIVGLNEINLLIFDDCHKSVQIDNHPYKDIVSQTVEMPSDQQPHILGLTAAIAGTDCSDPGILEDTVSSMENVMNAYAETSMLILSERFGFQPKEHVLQCRGEEEQFDVSTQLEDMLRENLDFFSNCNFIVDEHVDSRNPLQIPLQVLCECLNILQTLGSWSASSIAEYFVMQLEKIVKCEKNDIHKKFLRCVMTTLRRLTKVFENDFQTDYDVDELLEFTTPKVKGLVEILRKYKPEVDFMIIEDEASENGGSFSDLSDEDDDEDDEMNLLDTDDEDEMRKDSSPIKPMHIAVKRYPDGGYERLNTFSEEDDINLCGIVFVENRYVAFGLSKIIEEVCAWDENLCFVKSCHITGHGLKSGSGKHRVNRSFKRQEETLRKFRMQERNLVVATKELEEGIDIPKCNLVVLFDPPKEYRSYTLSKGRARARDASYYILLEDENFDSFSSHLRVFKGIEEVLLGDARRNHPKIRENEVDDGVFQEVLPPYSSANATVSMQSSISLINRYCAKLPSDAFTHLTPHCRVEEIEKDPSKFVAHLRLPINSPVKEELEGPVMPSKKMAKMAVALKMCEILHMKGELDDNLVPVGKEMFLYEEDEDWAEEDPGGQAQPGTTKRKQYYVKKVADALVSCQPKANEACYLYFFDLKLTGPITDEQNTRGRVIYAPEDTKQTLGVILSKQIPTVPCFPIYTRSGELTTSVDLLQEDVSFTNDEIAKLQKFHHFVFSGVLHLEKERMEYSPVLADSGFIIVPLNGMDELGIDWPFIDEVIEFICMEKKSNGSNAVSKDDFHFSIDDFKDAVVMPSYRNIDQPQHFYVAEIRNDLNPLSPFPSPELYKTFKDYYTTKYGLTITNTDQPLLDVDHTSARLNLLTPRYMDQRGIALPTSSAETKRAKRENLQQKQILVPELCDVHVFPASLWRKTVCLPAILYRTNCLLLAEELRRKISSETGIGVENLPDGFRFPQLYFGFETNPEKLKEVSSEIKSNQNCGSSNQSGSLKQTKEEKSPDNCLKEAKLNQEEMKAVLPSSPEEGVKKTASDGLCDTKEFTLISGKVLEKRASNGVLNKSQEPLNEQVDVNKIVDPESKQISKDVKHEAEEPPLNGFPILQENGIDAVKDENAKNAQLNGSDILMQNKDFSVHVNGISNGFHAICFDCGCLSVEAHVEKDVTHHNKLFSGETKPMAKCQCNSASKKLSQHLMESEHGQPPDSSTFSKVPKENSSNPSHSEATSTTVIYDSLPSILNNSNHFDNHAITPSLHNNQQPAIDVTNCNGQSNAATNAIIADTTTTTTMQCSTDFSRSSSLHEKITGATQNVVKNQVLSTIPLSDPNPPSNSHNVSSSSSILKLSDCQCNFSDGASNFTDVIGKVTSEKSQHSEKNNTQKKAEFQFPSVSSRAATSKTNVTNALSLSEMDQGSGNKILTSCDMAAPNENVVLSNQGCDKEGRPSHTVALGKQQHKLQGIEGQPACHIFDNTNSANFVQISTSKPNAQTASEDQCVIENSPMCQNDVNLSDCTENKGSHKQNDCDFPELVINSSNCMPECNGHLTGKPKNNDCNGQTVSSSSSSPSSPTFDNVKEPAIVMNTLSNELMGLPLDLIYPGTNTSQPFHSPEFTWPTEGQQRGDGESLADRVSTSSTEQSNSKASDAKIQEIPDARIGIDANSKIPGTVDAKIQSQAEEKLPGDCQSSDANKSSVPENFIKFSFSTEFTETSSQKEVTIDDWNSETCETPSKMQQPKPHAATHIEATQVRSTQVEATKVEATNEPPKCSTATSLKSSPLVPEGPKPVEDKSAMFDIGIWNPNPRQVASTLYTAAKSIYNAPQYQHLHSHNANQSTSLSLDQDLDLKTFVGPNPCLILQALTMSNANDFFNLERLETIGDSFLKYAITVYLYCSYPGIHEGKLSYLRSKQVSNYNLYRLGRRKALPEYMVSTKFEPYENWLPPGFVINEERRRGPVPKVVLVPPKSHTPQVRSAFVDEATDAAKKDEACQFDRELEWIQRSQEADQKDDLEDPDRSAVPYSLQLHHGLPDKSVADCIEALIGCYLTTCGKKAALMFMSWLGLKVMSKKKAKGSDKNGRKNSASRESSLMNQLKVSEQEIEELQCPPSPMFSPTPENYVQLNHLLEGFDALEEKICYKFRDRSYLLQAFTHASFHYNTITDCYQRIEFLGDAILDYVITRHLYEDSKRYSPGILTDLRSALVNNNIFAALAVKWGFHLYFKAISPSLFAVIDKFVTKQIEKNQDDVDIDEEYREVSLEDVEIEDTNEDNNEEEVEMEIPKALGDIFESVAGAIYLDSGMSLDAVWRVYYRLMKLHIDKYLISIPKSPVRELLEREPETAKFERPERTMNGKVRVTVNVVGKGVFSGIGRNYRIAKSAAAKKALRFLHSMTTQG